MLIIGESEKHALGKSPAGSPSGEAVKVPPEHWRSLKEKDIAAVCRNASAQPHPPGGIRLHFLREELLVDLESCCLRRFNPPGSLEKIEDPLLELIVLVYLLNAAPASLSNDLVGPQELKQAHFFQGPHALKITPLVERYGNDLPGFKQAAEHLDGTALELADAAFRFLPLPKAPLYYLLWEGDAEFEPRLSILFDRSIEQHLSADAIWGMVNLVSDALLRGSRGNFLPPNAGL